MGADRGGTACPDDMQASVQQPAGGEPMIPVKMSFVRDKRRALRQIVVDVHSAPEGHRRVRGVIVASGRRNRAPNGATG